MKRFAFIDFQNTDSTTKQLLNFEIDWLKLCNFLKNKWDCEKVYIYAGIDRNNINETSVFDNLEKSGFIIKSKAVFAYKNKDREINVLCPNCKNKFVYLIDMGYNKKSNCDVDLTVDAINLAGHDKEFFLFTGDGDFKYLVEDLVLKGVKVCIVSSAKRIYKGNRYFTSRLSKKLRAMFTPKSDKVYFREINNLREKIKKM
jgi:uncharacterized LabA/DUF88 family protein